MTLYLQAATRIIGMHPNRGRFAAELVRRAEAVGDDAAFRTIGVWEFVGLTGDWSRVFALYEFRDGWDTVAEQVRATMGTPPPELAEIYRVADSMRSGGVDEIVEPLPGCPAWAGMTGAGRGPLLVSETVRVPVGGAAEYAADVVGRIAPRAAEHGVELLGLFRAALTDDQVFVHWTSDLSGYRSLMAAGGPGPAPPGGRRLHTSWRQELWVAATGSRFAGEL